MDKLTRKERRKSMRKEKKKLKAMRYSKSGPKEELRGVEVQKNKQKMVKPNQSKKIETLKEEAKLARQKRSIENEDQVIRKMEKKLKLNKRKKDKLPSSFYEEGLGDLLDFLDGACKSKDSTDRLNEEEDMNDEESESCSSNEEMDAEEQENNSSNEDEENSDDEKLNEDIYGRVIDKKGNIVTNNLSINNQIIQPVDTNLIDPTLLRRLRGLLNRVAASNLPSISSEIVDLFQTYSMFSMNEGLTICIKDLIIKNEYFSPLKLVCELAMLITILHCKIGDEVGGHMIHSFIKELDSLICNKILDNKRIDNVMAFILHLYGCDVIDSSLIYEILEKLCQNFEEKTIELIILSFTLAGFILRKDKPVRMKDLLILIQNKANNRKNEFKESRINFMLETLAAIKNNNILKITSSSSTILTPIDIQSIRSNLKHSFKGNNASVNSLPGAYTEVLGSNRWWIKSGQLIETDTSHNMIHANEPSPDIEYKMCRLMRLNTPLRKLLFNSLLSSENYIDAAVKMAKIAKKQSTEVINVVVHVALHEKEINLYYVHLLKHLASMKRNYKINLNFALRDKITDLMSFDKKQRTNLSKFIFELIKESVVPITVLKVIEFNDINEDHLDFLKNILTSIMKVDNQLMKDILIKIPPKDTFATAIRLFISCFLDADCKEKFKKFKEVSNSKIF